MDSFSMWIVASNVSSPRGADAAGSRVVGVVGPAANLVAPGAA
ncbi:hypothetical protein [Cellulomonas sp. URHB0016]